MPSPLPNEWATEPCIDLINTRFDDHLGSGRVHDRLPMPLWRRAFLKHWHYQVNDPDDPAAIDRLARLRSLLRPILENYIKGTRLEPSMRTDLESEMNRAAFVVRIISHHGSEGLALQRQGDAWDIVTADIATSAMRLIGRRKRVKVCANPHCSWMFEDESKSGSRRWCDVSICGSLVNVRRYRGAAAQ